MWTGERILTGFELVHEGLNLPDIKQITTVGYGVFIASLVMTVYSGCEYVYKNKDVFSM